MLRASGSVVDARASDDFSFFPSSLSRFFSSQFVAFPLRILDPFLTLPGGAFARGVLPAAQFIGIGLGQVFERLDLFLGLFEPFFKRAAGAKRTIAGVGTDSHAVLRDPIHGDQAFVHERGDNLREQLVPLLAPPRAKIGERVIVDRDAAAKPLISQMVLAKSFQFPRAADASERGEHPKRHEQPGIDGVAADMMFDRLDLLEPGIEIKLTDKVPDHPRLRIGVEPLVERFPAHFGLIADRDAKPRLAAAEFTSGLFGGGIGEVVAMEREVGHENLAIECVDAGLIQRAIYVLNYIMIINSVQVSYDVPLVEVREALDYVANNLPLIESERDGEAADIRARGLDQPLRS